MVPWPQLRTIGRKSKSLQESHRTSSTETSLQGPLLWVWFEVLSSVMVALVTAVSFLWSSKAAKPSSRWIEPDCTCSFIPKVSPVLNTYGLGDGPVSEKQGSDASCDLVFVSSGRNWWTGPLICGEKHSFCFSSSGKWKTNKHVDTKMLGH